jgi:hypothetical protein
MGELAVYSIAQPALVVDDLEVAVDRMHDLFGAVPSERLPGRNAVYAFENETFLELLGPVEEGHTRWRFLRRFGPGYYMFCADLENTDLDEVEGELARLGKRVVDGGRRKYEGNVLAGYHIHPRDACGMIMLLTVKSDRRENGLWAGFSYRAYIPGNSRYVREIRGVLARTADPAAEAPGFGEMGLAMAPLGATGAWGWQGRTGTRFELWPATSWAGGPVDERRDYALCLRARDVSALLARLSRFGLAGERRAADGRWLTNPDPVLGVRRGVEGAGGHGVGVTG